MGIEMYIGTGFYLFPINAETKKPAIMDNLESASCDPVQWDAWATQFPGCNWGLSLAKSGLVAVDVDVKHSGIELWESLTLKNSVPNTLMALTGSEGRHFVFMADRTARYRGKIVRGIDVKHHGYIVVEPSIHPNGNPYEWVNWGQTPTEVPLWLKDFIVKTDSGGHRVPIKGLGKDYLSRCVAELKKFDLGYDEWVEAGMAIHSAQPDEIGRELFLDLTEGVSYVAGDVEKAMDKWRGFKTTGGVTVRTLTWMIRSKGGKVPNPTTSEDLEMFREAEKKELDLKRRTSKGFEEIANGRFICWNEARIVEYFNEQGFAFCRDDLKNPFAIVSRGEHGVNSAKRTTINGLRDLTAMYFYATKKFTDTGIKTVHTPAIKSWVESGNRKTYERVVFDPIGDRKDEYNLWAGIPCEPLDGEPKATLDVIYEALCDGDDEKANWFLDWLAHIVQFPTNKSTIVPVFVGLQGTGKGLLNDFIMRNILGDLYVSVATSQELLGRFNLHLGCKLLTHIDEATWRGNKTEDGILKSIIGSPMLSVEEKFGGRFMINNFSRYIISSNNKEAVALEVGNRRYCLIETSKRLANDLGYFGPKAEIMKSSDEARRFFGFLMQRDLINFNPYRILKGNTAGGESKIASEGSVAAFWEDLLLERPKEIMVAGDLIQDICYDEFIAFNRAIGAYEKAISAKMFWAKSRRLIPLFERSKRSRKRLESRLVYCLEKTTVELMRRSFLSNLVLETPQQLPESTEYEICSC